MPATAISLPFAFLNLGPFEIALICFVILLLFGAKRLPELAKGFGKAIREFKKASSEAESEIREAIADTPKPTPTAKTASTNPPPSGNN